MSTRILLILYLEFKINEFNGVNKYILYFFKKNVLVLILYLMVQILNHGNKINATQFNLK
jgi:hypothetical protein